MALQTITTIKIGQAIIRNFTRLRIEQKIHDHHTFAVEVRQDLLVEEFKSVMPVSQQLYGASISIEIKPIPDLDDAVLREDPRNYLMQFYGIVTGVSMQKSCVENIEETLLIEGCSNSILLESGPQSNSFTAMNLEDIVKKVTAGYDIDMQVTPLFRDTISYTVQYNESCFAFLNRLAKRYGQYFYDNGRVLIFGDASPVIEPRLLYGVNMRDFKYKIKLKPVWFTIIENDNREGIYVSDDTLEYKKELNGFHQNFVSKSKTIYNKSAVLQLNQNAAGSYAGKTVEEYTQNKMRAILSSLTEITASSEVPGVTVGNTVRISGIDKQQEGTYRVTKIVHTCDDGGGYENHFKAVNTSDSSFSPKTNPDLVPYCTSQTAVITANSDPDGLSAVKVQMPWQAVSGQTTPYIPLVQKYSGDAKGSHWIPEIGEQVFVDFQGNNAELPIVVGAMTSRKEKSGYSTQNNDIKALHTRSNNKLVMNDAEGSVLLQDAAKSFIDFDGKRKIELNTDIFEINVKKLIINATQSTEITTNDYMLNALTKIYVLSKTMKQTIQGFMSLYSGKALINSNDSIDIEAKTAKLHGSEKALFHSDKEAVINSKGTAKMHGEEGNSLTNKAKKVTSSDTDTAALAVVYFRPLSTWKGEFGFDWLREKDNGLSTEPDYESIIQGGYKDGKDNLSKLEAYEKLKGEYSKITMARKNAQSGQASKTEYFAPYLALFSKEFVEAMPKNTLVKPCWQADLKILVDIDEDLEKLEFEYDDTLIQLSACALKETTKTDGLKASETSLKIQCLKDLDRDYEIIIYAYPKNKIGVHKTKLETITERKIAGKIILLRNDALVRREERIVLISVQTNIIKIPEKKEQGKFSAKEKYDLYKILHQAFILPVTIETALDVRGNQDFEIGGKYIDVGKNNAISHLDKVNRIKNASLYTEIINLFQNQKDNSGVLYKELYSEYFTVFKFGTFSNKDNLGGSADSSRKKNAIMYTLPWNYEIRPSTLVHEILHGLGLFHTHIESSPIDHPNYRYVYPYGSTNPENATTNIMSYKSDRFTTWHWQCKIINKNLKLK